MTEAIPLREKQDPWSEKRAASYGWIEAAPVITALRRWHDAQSDVVDTPSRSGANQHRRGDKSFVPTLSPVERLAFMSGVSKWVIEKILYGSADRKKWIDFDEADALICAVDVFLWMTDPDLHRAYQRFDFTCLDRKRPVALAS